MDKLSVIAELQRMQAAEIAGANRTPILYLIATYQQQAEAATTEQEIATLVKQLKTNIQALLTPPETTPELQKFKEDYENSKLTLDFFELTQKAKTPMPTWEQIQPRLTPEVLQKAKNLHQPKLICIPTRDKQDKPLRYQELAATLNQAKANGKTSATHTGENTFVWDEIQNGTKVQYQNQSQADYFKAQPDWQVYLVEAADNMPTPDQLPNNLFPDFPTNGTDQTKFDYMLKEYEKLNLQGLTYEMWAILLMDALRNNQTIDGTTFTCLLANKLDVTNVLPAARWGSDRPNLSFWNSDYQNDRWRSRAAVRVM